MPGDSPCVRFAQMASIAVDRAVRPNIGAMMFLPHLRVAPMHLMSAPARCSATARPR